MRNLNLVVSELGSSSLEKNVAGFGPPGAGEKRAPGWGFSDRQPPDSATRASSEVS